jgi:hypothetical protein
MRNVVLLVLCMLAVNMFALLALRVVAPAAYHSVWGKGFVMGAGTVAGVACFNAIQRRRARRRD